MKKKRVFWLFRDHNSSRKDLWFWIGCYFALGALAGWAGRSNYNMYAGEMNLSDINISVQDTLPATVSWTGASGATDSNGTVWIKSGFNKSDFMEICSHEVLHNILKLPSLEIEWGTSEEHKIIFELEDKINFSICEVKAYEIYGMFP